MHIIKYRLQKYIKLFIVSYLRYKNAISECHGHTNKKTIQLTNTSVEEISLRKEEKKTPKWGTCGKHSVLKQIPKTQVSRKCSEMACDRTRSQKEIVEISEVESICSANSASECSSDLKSPRLGINTINSSGTVT